MLLRMPRATVLILFAMVAEAGVIQGVALEHATGRALARAIVTLEPVPGTTSAHKPVTARSGRSGQFVFPAVPPGLYRIVAQRLGYFPAWFGQRRPTGQAPPIAVTSDSKTFAELRLRRLGAITGTVMDENGVGMAGVSVVAYKAVLPLRPAGKGEADDRGVFRVGGLKPGRYWVRSATHTLEDGTGLLPTFSPQGAEIRDARSFEVHLDGEAIDAKVYPQEGKLFRMEGGVSCDHPSPSPITITLVSETGRQSMQVSCNGGFLFDRLAPMAYEVIASNKEGTQVSYMELVIQRDLVLPVSLSSPPRVEFDAGKTTSLTLTGRRADLAALEEEMQIPLPATLLFPGYWNFKATTGPNQYVESIGTMRPVRRRPWRPERPPDAHEVYVEQYVTNRLRVNISDKAARISGVVIGDGKAKVPGAPVFLWPVSEASQRILGGPRETLSDVDGQFRFQGLPPGEYRLLATFDTTEVNVELLEEAHAQTIQLDASQAAGVDLTLWIAP